MSLDLVRTAALDVLMGRETAHSVRVLKSIQGGLEGVRERDPQTYRFVKRAMIERLKRQIRRAA
ncbi:MAG: hypothetical protein AB1405_11130 [Bdellovibrionota bacterium]